MFRALDDIARESRARVASCAMGYVRGQWFRSSIAPAICVIRARGAADGPRNPEPPPPTRRDCTVFTYFQSRLADRSTPRNPVAWRTIAVAVAVVLALLVAVRPAAAEFSVGGVLQHSPDDISAANVPGLQTLTGNDVTASVTLPFPFVVEGTPYTTLVLSSNGWIEFGGNTSGNSDPTNDCLPTAAHTNPFLAVYWDDLAPFGTNVRYGTVGTSPNRVFLADFEVDLTSGNEGSDDLRFQVQLHEGSNLATVRYRDSQSNANGQSATIGYQGPGGAAATTVEPISCNGKALDDNRPDEGWSADLGRAGDVVLAAMMQASPDDLGGFTALPGNDAVANVALPFAVEVEGVTYGTVAISTNGWLELGGNTAGDSDPSNDCLPTAAHSNPLIAAYWDDLNPFGTGVRYGTLGQSPNRIFVVDYQADMNVGEGSDDNAFQIEIHETSNLINVRYRDKQNVANGQGATIGFQGAGGAGAATYPVTCNGKVLDDNDPAHEGWSVHPRASGAMSLHAILAFSPDDISAANVPGLGSFSGNDVVQTATLPFAVSVAGVNYNTVAISTNGWLELGGNTAPNSDPVNDCLPTAKHTNPFIAAFWDDMQTAGSSSIQYGTVGSAPNRTFLADFFLDTRTSGDDGSDDARVQVQIHETSNLIVVKYPPNQRLASGQTATIGFQGAGGAAADAVPIGCNASLLDDNISDTGWSIAPLPVCGDGVAEQPEDCDAGAANGTPGSCCSASCTLVAAGTACRAATDVCDAAESCNGASGVCPADGFVAAGTTCRAGSGDACDPSETCTGSAAACPADVVLETGAVCRAGSGDACDPDETCSGVAGEACPADVVTPAATVCRTGSGDACDPDEACSGVAGEACPSDVVVAAGVACRAAVDLCDAAEACTGVAQATCPPDGLRAAGTECRAAGGACDVAETCDGSGSACPADQVRAAGFECRAAAGACDVAEQCDGTSAGCPGDALVGAGTECRAAAGECDLAESCSGASADCPADAFAASGVTCTDDADLCTLDACDGAGTCQHTALPDSDGDSVCDAQDACTNVAGGRDFLVKPKPKLLLARINSDSTPGNDKLVLNGNFALPAGTTFADLDPRTRGARVVVASDAGTVRVDQTLPGGAYPGGKARGWKTNAKGTQWQYVDRTASPLAGITGLKILDQSKAAPRHVRVIVTGKNGTYPVVAGDPPLGATVVLGNQSDAVAGACGETAFGAADCAFNRAQNQVTCKK
jgi:hypothetical protein